MRAAALALASLVGCEADPAGEETRTLLRQYGCPACHVIPGTAGPEGATGPPLTAMAEQVYVAGVVANTPEALAAFIADPQAVDPRSAMPDLGVSAEEAEAMAAYLYAVSGSR